MFRSFDLGDSLLGIVNALNDEGITTISGKQWRPPSVYHILRNETYTGRTVYRRTHAIKVRDPDQVDRAGEWSSAMPRSGLTFLT